MKKWVCKTCGYVHRGETPPEKCSVCRVPAEQFDLQQDESKTVQTQVQPSNLPLFIQNNRLLSLLATEFPLRQLHPITVHFPNGLIPVSVFFLLLSLFFNFACIDLTAFYLLCAATALSPCAFATGIYSWKTKYKGASTPNFRFKLYGSIIFMILALLTIALRLFYPQIAASAAVVYFIVNLILLGMVTALGHIGGRFVFGAHKN